MRPGALVISLDFELHWGMRDHVARHDAAYRALPAARQAVIDISELFSAGAIRATWAAVGFLFARNRLEIEMASPGTRPHYGQPNLDPYLEAIGEDEGGDPQHMAGSLIEHLAASPGQEVGSHTFSHFYCLESGQNEMAFRADLDAAIEMARLRDLRPTSLVLPRNQWNPAYTKAVLDHGFTCIRGPQPTFGHEPRASADQRRVHRLARLADAYVGTSAPPTTAWEAVEQPSGLCDVPASAFLRPYSPSRRHLEPLRMRRLISGMRSAARNGRIFHLWWHPHNFSSHRAENLAVLGQLLAEFDRLALSDGMQSLSMGDVASQVIRSAGESS
jgi:peptidoglycan/xylan/chitin deacetylase (PgdA/CDA1 family)